MSTTMPAPAIVAYAPSTALDLRYEQVNVRTAVMGKEILIKMCATGVCHTDVMLGSVPAGTLGISYPRVLGHEGTGHVQAVGESVTIAKVGDPVLLSYNYCGHCDLCATGRLSYCVESTRLNAFGSDDSIFTDENGANTITGSFFGQSSFSSLTIVQEACVVNLSGLVDSIKDLQRFAPLGCGLLTGSGSVFEAGQTRPQDVVVVFGLGGVGLGAIMAAKIVGCKAIIAVDRIESRIEVAKSLGATHAVNTAGLTETDIVPHIQSQVPEERISLTIETTGVSFISAAAIACLGLRGRFLQVGVPTDRTANLTIPIADLFGKRKILEGNIMGSAQARKLIPELIKWYREGRFPLDTLMTFFDARHVKEAIQGMKDGSVIKPVLLW